MAKSVNQKTGIVSNSRVFNYRCFVAKPMATPVETVTVTEQFHLERGENWDVKIVEDRPTDWEELANMDVDKVGLRNVLVLAQKGLVDPSTLAFNDNEALDLSGMNPMDPNSIKSTIQNGDIAAKKLVGIAAQLNVTVDELITSFMNGTFADLVNKQTEKKEGEE